ncbi:sugar ABC transporter ATP-binding protein [Herbiconiux sp. P17]|uniref:sugar ABC transporter ATP-binding protein n=1 Tax=Herbiconiux wuyangfengii TaxID=3342794 RepID=UPI0035BAFA35
MTEAVVAFVDVSKAYPGVVALNHVSLELRAGAITALAGENGAGKSTLIKVLSGAVRADSGEVRIAGETLPTDPGGVIGAGVSVIYQELTDVPDMTVTDNLLLGRMVSRFGVVRSRRSREIARTALRRVGLGDLDPNRSLSSLTMAQRQLVEIARCLARDAKVLIFDEPTSSLPEADVEKLLEIIRGLKAEGLAILYVSHHLAEFFAIADEIVVMRDGGVVGKAPTSEWDEPALIRAMLARDLENAYPWSEREPGEVRLAVTGLEAPGVHAATLTARSAEIVGLVGLDGAGRTELMKAVAGATRPTAGTVEVDGAPTVLGSIPRARRAGIVYAPEDRKREALLLTAPIRDNLILGLYHQVARAGVVLSRLQSAFAARSIRDFGVKTDSAWQAVGTLSGGNQQKVILARVAASEPGVILLDDPTRGVDVGAKSSIYTEVLGQVQRGATVLLTSSDTDEVLAMSDRIYVLRGGRIVREVSRPDFDRESILTSASLG